MCFDPVNGKNRWVVGNLVDQSAEISAVQYVAPDHDRRIAVQRIIVSCCRATRGAIHEYLDVPTLGSGCNQVVPTAVIDGGGAGHADVRISRKKSPLFNIAMTKSFATPPTSDQSNPLPSYAWLPVKLLAVVLIQSSKVKFVETVRGVLTKSAIPSNLAALPKFGRLG